MARKKRADVNAQAAGFGGSFGDLLKAQGLVAQDAAPPPAPEAEEAAPSPLEIKALRFEIDRKGRRGKTVTRVLGISGDRRALIKEIKRALGCGVSEEDDCLIVQGDHREALARLFESRAVD